MSQNPATPSVPPPEPSMTTCRNCHSPMPAELRFCRNCGYRLGEGIAEYTETVRFADAHAMSNSTSSAQPLVTSYGLSSNIAGTETRHLTKRKKLSGMTWIFLGLLTFFILAAAFTAIVTPIRRTAVGVSGPIIPKTRSYFGVNGFESTDGGVTFDNVEPPGSPADKAGLVGGDIITHFDGKPVENHERMMEILEATPIGATVDVRYLRDGEAKTTKMTTFAQEDSRRMERAFESRPEGRGRLGFNDDLVEKFADTEKKIFGVRLQEGAIEPSLPADMAGIKDGDIIVEFDKIPIRTGDEFVSRVRRAIPYSTVNIVLIRGTETLEIPVKMGGGRR